MEGNREIEKILAPAGPSHHTTTTTYSSTTSSSPFCPPLLPFLLLLLLLILNIIIILIIIFLTIEQIFFTIILGSISKRPLVLRGYAYSLCFPCIFLLLFYCSMSVAFDFSHILSHSPPFSTIVPSPSRVRRPSRPTRTLIPLQVEGRQLGMIITLARKAETARGRRGALISHLALINQHALITARLTGSAPGPRTPAGGPLGHPCWGQGPGPLESPRASLHR